MLDRIIGLARRIYHARQGRDFRQKNARWVAIADSAIILSGSHIDFRTKKDDRTYLEIGGGSLVSINAIFETERGMISIGQNVNMGNTTIISRESVTIEDDVTMAWGITLYDHNSHSLDWEERKHDNRRCYEDYLRHHNTIITKDWAVVKNAPIRICRKAWIGFNVIILKGVTVGEGAVVGAGSVVTKDIPPYSVAAGNPARVVKVLPQANAKNMERSDKAAGVENK